MTPVVNGIEAEFGNQVEFRRINASISDGRAIFLSYGLRGHPSYIILNPDAEVLWLGLGEQTYDALQKQIFLTLGE